MDSNIELLNILEFFQTRRVGGPGGIPYDSEFCQCLLKTFGATEASIWKLDPDGRLHYSFGTEVAADEISDISLRSGEGIGGAVVLSRKAINVKDAWQEPRHDRRVDERLKSRTYSMVSAPILFSDVFYGTLNIINCKSGGPFPERCKDLLSTAGTMYASALAATGRLFQVDGLEKQKGSSRSKGETVIVGVSLPIQQALSLCLKAAKSEVAVIIRGETGTGKELAARRIHEAGHRAKGPFVGVNCAALSETLLESELFGHVKGAFSGADRNREGKFLSAAKGTLFLDEIGDMSQACQAKILRVLQEKTVTPVGSEKSIECNPRIICATNHNLRKDIKNGQFREDLFYRLCGIEITMPPLRERNEDIPLLVNHFLRNQNSGKERGESMKPSAICDQAVNILKLVEWPGNVRQLEQAVRAAYAICDGYEIRPDDLPGWIRTARIKATATGENENDSENLDPSTHELGRFMRALESTRYPGTGRWNLTAAARSLSIPRKTFTYQLKKMKIL